MTHDERPAWRARPTDVARATTLRRVAWVVSALVILLVGLMQRIRLELPPGWSMGGLPAFHAAVNALCAVALLLAFGFIKRGRVRLHRAAASTALGLSVLFLLSYVTYHLTNEPTRYGGEGVLKVVYLVLLFSHIVAAALSFPFILFTFVAAWTDDFARHRRLARWVFPVWLYVAVTGPACYLMLRPYYAAA